MSTNIISLKIKEMRLSLPLTFDFQEWLDIQGGGPGVKWCKEEKDEVQAYLARGTWKLPLSEQEISGIIQDNQLIATAIECRSEGSSHIWSDVLLPLFEQFNSLSSSTVCLMPWSSGKMAASTV